MIGFSFGGWIAAEVAAGGHPKLDRLALVDPVGVKLAAARSATSSISSTQPGRTEPARLARPGQVPDGVYGLGWQA